VTYSWFPLAAPFLLSMAAFICFRGGGLRPQFSLRSAQGAGLAAMAVSLAGLVILIMQGPGTSPLLGLAGLGFSLRFDALSLAMQTLVSFIGWVVLRYAATYLDGEPRQGAFMGWLCATLAAVLALVSAGNLLLLLVAWVTTSLCLHNLLLFYPQRAGAQRAARKKFITARIGDGALASAFILLWVAFGTGDIGLIAAKARAGGDLSPLLVTPAAALIALAALLKSAQFPLHGWLTEVMETPTPVSALLHAGVINAGGFLLIRFADVLLLAPGVMALLAIVGGFTALFAGMVMLTQPAVKTALAWSTIGQMGFMILQCGLALFPLALLHIVAHSLYKAHAFLGSGGAVEQVASIRRPGPIAIPATGAVIRAFGLAVLIYLVIGLFFGLASKSPQAIAMGAILIFGVAYLIAQGLADSAPGQLTLYTGLSATVTAIGYFGLQTIAEYVMAGTLPATPWPDPLQWTLLILAVVSFGLVALAQAMFPLWAYHPSAAGLRVHLTNGFYANALFDRLIGGWNTRNPS
jgi:NAD(P)H-quinone oxidoreductase subunit 5